MSLSNHPRTACSQLLLRSASAVARVCRSQVSSLRPPRHRLDRRPSRSSSSSPLLRPRRQRQHPITASITTDRGRSTQPPDLRHHLRPHIAAPILLYSHPIVPDHHSEKKEEDGENRTLLDWVRRRPRRSRGRQEPEHFLAASTFTPPVSSKTPASAT
ncbi:extensin-like [Iris pallida]|uniref:Extensin-like n=1 Tax=Iris pallida TaxID=29817 RepID=A0AAX6G8T6_IRIPA|nr:extensin-like [Iris pallida]